ncbi:hypothetical protein ACX93W_07585 [Paenibacillus sp. CAU 1782]
MKDEALERKHAGQVRKKVGERLAVFGFKMTKPRFYTRLQPDWVEFLHVHKHKTDSSFRLNLGIRLIIDTMILSL